MERASEIRVAVACNNASGAPDFFFARVSATQAQYVAGAHYDAAKEAAREDGYAGPFVCFDERDGPAWLFKRFAKDVPAVTISQ